MQVILVSSDSEESEASRSFWSLPLLPRGSDRYTWKTSCCFQQGARFGRDNWASAQSPPPCRPPTVPLLWFPHAQSHFCLCSLSFFSFLLSHFVPVGRPRRQHLGLLALLEVSPPVDYAPLQLREGARGPLGLPSGESLSWNQREVHWVSFDIWVCVFERDVVLPDALAGPQVSLRLEGVPDIPESLTCVYDSLIRFSCAGYLSAAEKLLKGLLGPHQMPGLLLCARSCWFTMVHLYWFSDEGHNIWSCLVRGQRGGYQDWSK